MRHTHSVAKGVGKRIAKRMDHGTDESDVDNEPVPSSDMDSAFRYCFVSSLLHAPDLRGCPHAA